MKLQARALGGNSEARNPGCRLMGQAIARESGLSDPRVGSPAGCTLQVIANAIQIIPQGGCRYLQRYHQIRFPWDPNYRCEEKP